MARRISNVRERKQGGYELRFTYEGKRYSVYGATPTDCREAEIEKRKELDAGITGNSITFDKYFVEAMRQKRQHLKEATVRQYESTYDNYIKSSIGNMQIRKIERRHCLKLQKDTNDKMGAIVANAVMLTLHTVLKSAVIDEIILRNPADNIKSIKTDHGKQARETIHRALTKEDTAIFINTLSNKWEYELFVFLFTTGCRIGEAGALHWNDIDYQNKSVYISRTLTTDENGSVIEGSSAKTETSTRKIPLSSITIEALHSQHRKMVALFGSEIQNVFLTPRGSYITARIANRTIMLNLNEIKRTSKYIDTFSVHCTRDTFATRCIESGMNMNTLKEILGHSSITMTADLYAHVLPVTKAAELQTVNTGITYTLPALA
jgi:integrase